MSAVTLPTSRVQIPVADLPAKIAAILAGPADKARLHRAEEYLAAIRTAWPTRKPRSIGPAYRELAAYGGRA